MKKWIMRLAIVAMAAFLLLWSVVTVASVYFVARPRLSDFDDLETLGAREVEAVDIATDDGVGISAWYVHAHPERAVILLAGIDANRNAMRSRAEYYLEREFSVLLPDLRATGKSGGRAVTIGWRERKDLVACFRFLEAQGYRQIGANGISLGAATICYAMPELPDLAFVVLESSYDTLANAVKNRLGMYNAPHFIAYPFYAGFSVVAGTPSWRMRPSAYMSTNDAPLLIMAGDAEPELKVSETQSLYDNSNAPHKYLHFFKEGRHQDFLRRYTEEYTTTLDAFLQAHVSHN